MIYVETQAYAAEPPDRGRQATTSTRRPGPHPASYPRLPTWL
jgi:hypothetical protein